ncbi:MAG: flagellar basal body rod protein FlgB [Pseudomonadota bacterium]
MDLSKIAVFDALTSKMSYLNNRATLLAENVANANTPGYVARDLENFTFDDALAEASGPRSGAPALRASEPGHITPSGGNASSFKAVSSPDSDASINGNAVALEDQMLKVADTQMQYQMATSLYRKGLNMLRVVVARGGN